jgi:hypothetical protein
MTNELEASAAHAALSRSARRILTTIRRAIERAGATSDPLPMTLADIEIAAGTTRASIGTGLRELRALKFISTGVGAYRVYSFQLLDGWRDFTDAREARALAAAARAPQPRQPRAPKAPKPQRAAKRIDPVRSEPREDVKSRPITLAKIDWPKNPAAGLTHEAHRSLRNR